MNSPHKDSAAPAAPRDALGAELVRGDLITFDVDAGGPCLGVISQWDEHIGSLFVMWKQPAGFIDQWNAPESVVLLDHHDDHGVRERRVRDAAIGIFPPDPRDSAVPAAPPVAAAETAEPSGSVAPPGALPEGLPPSTQEAVDLARAVRDALRRSESRVVKLSVTCGQLRGAMLRAALLIAEGNPAAAEVELRMALEVGA